MSEQKSKSRAIGTDPGTVFFQTAEMGENNIINTKTIRNAFVEMSATEDIEETLKQNKWHYIKDGEHYYVIGEDALKVARMFPGKVELRRPMQDGVLNKGEEKKMVIMSELISSSIGQATDDDSLVCFCVSSESVDGAVDNTFHKARLQGMFERLGYKCKVIEEGLAVVLAERPTIIEADGSESPYSGIGVSFGGGKVNCVLAYKGLPIVGMSVAKSGDYIDKQVSSQTDTPIAQVTAKKERELDFENLNYDDDVIFALDAYYSEMIRYVFTYFAKKFSQVKSEFDAPLDIVVAGGTSMPKGFCKKIEEVVKKLELPFKIKEVRASKDPRNAVVKGCLAQAIISQKKLTKEIKETKEGNTTPKTENKDEIDKVLGG